MAFTHTNKITYSYTAGGSTSSKVVSKSESAGAELNLSEQITIDADSVVVIDILDFEFDNKTQARSVLLKSDGAAVSIYANDATVGGNLMGAALADGEPYVWCSSDGSTNNFPPGNTNPMIDDTLKLEIKPTETDSAERTPTITIRVLYDPTP